MIAVPLSMKYVCDTLDDQLFIHKHESPNGKLKAGIFYFGVLGLSILTLIKAIQGNPAKFIEKPLVN